MRCVLLPGVRSLAGTERRMCWLRGARRSHCQSDEIVASISVVAQVARRLWHMQTGDGRWPQRTDAGGVLKLRTVNLLLRKLLLLVSGLAQRYLKS